MAPSTVRPMRTTHTAAGHQFLAKKRQSPTVAAGQEVCSPRERRCAVGHVRSPHPRAVLSARAEVCRGRGTGSRRSGGALRASGGVPPQQHYERQTAPCSPRERRCAAPRPWLRRGLPVLSARAEVCRRCCLPQPGAGRALRASGGVPGEQQVIAVRPLCSPRERRCAGAPGTGSAPGGVLSARAEVCRRWSGSASMAGRALRASGGVPYRRPVLSGPVECSPRERRCAVPAAHAVVVGVVLSARAEVCRGPETSGASHTSALRASGGVPSRAAPPRTSRLCSPRERRCAVRRSLDGGHTGVLSARAEVCRCSNSSWWASISALRASGGVPAGPSPDGNRDQCSPRERRCAGHRHGIRRPLAVLSARAEVCRPRSPDGRPPDRALRASGGVPDIIRVEWAEDACSPRERRCAADRRRPHALDRVLSARAEVCRRGHEGPGPLDRALRASGGVPSCSSWCCCWGSCSPRERRCAGGPGVPGADGGVLSARAEVCRSGSGVAASTARALRASGGVPPSCDSSAGGPTCSPRERRCADAPARLDPRRPVLSARAEVCRRNWKRSPGGWCALRASGGVPARICVLTPEQPCSPRERRCADDPRLVGHPRPVLSARAEVCRCRPRGSRPSTSALRASGGVPFRRRWFWAGFQCSPRERRCADARLGAGLAEGVLSARAEVCRVTPPSRFSEERALRASGGVPPLRSRPGRLRQCSPRERRRVAPAARGPPWQRPVLGWCRGVVEVGLATSFRRSG